MSNRSFFSFIFVSGKGRKALGTFQVWGLRLNTLKTATVVEILYTGLRSRKYKTWDLQHGIT